MKIIIFKKIHLYAFILICINVFPISAQNFSSSTLQGVTIANPTSLQFGPDGKLYVAQQDGAIKIFTIVKNSPGNYNVTSTETVLLIKQIPNHFDDGTSKPYNITTNKRQITGIYVTGTASTPIIYVNSSDNDIGAGSNGDKNLCTNSGIISKLTRSGASWTKVDLVRGLPRSEENHATNGLQLDEQKNILYTTSAGLTNAGSPSKLFAYISEYALSACILSIDLNVIEAMPLKNDATGSHPYKYDLPTLNDPTRSNNPDGTDVNDPFGGNDGLNQAKIIQGGPVKIFAPGFRNPYDILITKTPGKARNIYVSDNGANPNWGGHPDQEGTANATNKYLSGEPGSNSAGPNDPMVNNLDAFHRIGNLDTYSPGTYYGGHPCPTRANPSGAGLYTHQGTLDAGTGVWRTSKTDPNFPLPSDWPPLPLSMANTIEGNFQNPGETNSALLTFDNSTNGLCEYTASNYNGSLKGDLFTVSFDGNIYRIKLNSDGSSVLNSKGSAKINKDAPFASGFGSKPLDITAQGDNQIFPGSIWTAVYAGNSIVVFEPQAIACAGNYSTADEDGDKYTNADEIDNNTDPCSAASKPDDNDKDFISDLKDADDDNDGISDLADYFQIDASNGMSATVPFSFSLFNNDPGTGFFGVGFTGLMNNGTNYINLYNKNNLIAGGAIGAFTIDEVPTGDALGNNNNQNYGFQFGVKINSQTAPFTIKTKILGTFFNNQTPTNFQSQGFYIGTGDQNNYLKIVLNANNGNGGIEVVYENAGTATSFQYNISSIPSGSVDLFLSINPSTGKVQPKYSINGGALNSVGSAITLSGALLNTLQGSSALAVGIIATSRGSSVPFNATWDLIEATFDNQSGGGTPSKTALFFINAGGNEISATPINWLTDTQTNPSPYTNSSMTFVKVATYTGTNNTDAPTSIFSSSRNDGGTAGESLSKEMQWNFPVTNGKYEVNLYFAETAIGAKAAGVRVFDVAAEGVIALNDYDIYADAGFNAAAKKSFVVDVNDGNLDIDFLHVKENPRVNGIAIYSISSTSPPPVEPPVATNITVKITNPLANAVFSASTNIPITAEVTDNNSTTGSYLKITCPDAAWRKLKLGYSATGLYSPKNNVLTSGNSFVEITLKDFNNNINWNKIQIRPQGYSSTPVIIGNYIASAEQLTDSWKKIKIPLSAFPPEIDFSQLSFIEIPYSAAAGIFNIGLREIKFIGGSVPFLWFGGNKTDNFHDGKGGAGQLTASLITDNSGTTPTNITKVEFYHGKTKIGEDNAKPYQFTWSNVNAGIYYLKAIALLENNSIAKSDSIKIIVEDNSFSGPMKITIVFDETPSEFSITKAPLKYNKDFAYSFTLDDGKEDAYTNAFPLFNGGFINGNGKTYTGLHYTDGCGNQIPFRAGLAWNSVNSSGTDTHNNTPGYMTWQQLSFLYNQKWNIFNHSYDHSSGAGTNYSFQVSENNVYVKNKTGITLSHFVVPSGDTNYVTPAFNYGMKAVYNQSGNFPGIGGLKVDGTLQLQNFKLNRHFIYDSKYDTTNITVDIDAIAAKSINGNHYWFNDFTHNIGFTLTGGSLLFSKFEYYMKYLESTYGKNGSDRMWMAPLQEVYEYLAVKNNITYTTNLSGNKLDIIFNNLPNGLDKNALSLIVNSQTNFSNVEVYGVANYSFKGTGDNKLVNIEWENTPVNLSASRTSATNNEILYRINAGGSQIGSSDTSGTWAADNANNPSVYVNLVETNYKINFTTDSISLSHSIPKDTPKEIFQNDRAADDTDGSALRWEFPVAPGGEVEVRLYFSEMFFNTSDERVFNVEIEDTVKISNYDIYKDAGKNVGTVKSFKTTSDGNINVNLIRIKQQPKINGIEIICLNDKCNRNNLKFASLAQKTTNNITAYPNPFNDVLKINFDSQESTRLYIKMYNSMGQYLPDMDVNIKESQSELEIDMSELPIGIYFLKVGTDKRALNNTIRLVKQ